MTWRAVVRSVAIPASVAAVAACADLIGTHFESASFSIVPTFDAYGALASNADSLRIRVFRGSADGEFTDLVRDTTVSIDPVTGEAGVNLTVALLQSPQQFLVQLEAIRTSDGMVLFSGSDVVSVRSGDGGGGDGGMVEIPVSYQGPKAASLSLEPADTSMAPGGSFLYRAVAMDSASNVIDVPINFFLVTLSDSTQLRVDRLSGLVTAAPNGSGEVFVGARTPDSLAADTARVFIGAVPAGVRVAPGYANVGVAQTVQLSASIVDGSGNPLTSTGITYSSRSPSVADVNASSGLVTGAAPGTAIILAEGSGFSDSALITVPIVGDVIVSAVSNDRAFRFPRLGETVVVDVIADMRFAGGELLGSYNATLFWDISQLAYDSTASGDFSLPVLNDAAASDGELRFAQADANGMTGEVVLARVYFTAVGQGDASLSLAMTEMSGISPTFTDLRSRITVTDGHVMVRP